MCVMVASHPKDVYPTPTRLWFITVFHDFVDTRIVVSVLDCYKGQQQEAHLFLMLYCTRVA